MMTRKAIVIAAVVLLLSAGALADSVGDPGGIIRRGNNYSEGSYAIIGPGLTLTFNDQVVTSFNPFTAGFCSAVEGGQQCNFENQSGEVIFNVNQLFAATPAQFEANGGMSCQNDINPEAGCGTDPGNVLFFPGLGIPSVTEGSSVLGASTNTDPDFNILYFGFPSTNNFALANISSTAFNVPEPSSLVLLFAGLIGLGIGRRRFRLAKVS